MDSARLERIQEIFHRLSDLPPSEQPGRLAVACAGDQSLMAELEAMLEEDARGKSMLDGGLSGVAQTLLQRPHALFAEAGRRHALVRHGVRGGPSDGGLPGFAQAARTAGPAATECAQGSGGRV